MSNILRSAPQLAGLFSNPELQRVLRMFAVLVAGVFYTNAATDPWVNQGIDLVVGTVLAAGAWYFSRKSDGKITDVKTAGTLGVVGLIFGLLGAQMVGCTRVGGQVSQNARGVLVDNPSPNTLTMRDLPSGESQWTSNGIGPSQFTDMTSEGVQTFRQGSTPREVMYDGVSKRFLLSSGADISAEALEIDPNTGVVRVGKFSTSASEPIRASNEAYKDLVPFWQSLTQAERDAVIAELETSETISESVKPVLVTLLQGLLK